MSGRGIERDPRGRRRWAGRGSPPPAREAREAHKTEAKFKGANPELPSLNYGASPKENGPIEFLQLMGEYCARTYKDGIAQAFWTTPPQFGEEEEEPIMPEAIPNTNAGKVIIADFTNDKKEWKLDKKKVTADKKTAFAVTYGQLAEASRSEVQDHEDWTEAFINRDLLFLIERIRSTHVARQSGNPRQDMERVRNLWSSRSMHMQPHESSFAFRDYQLERVAVGLPEILEEELVIGILNRLDMSRYHSLVKDYLDNERRGISELPELSSTLWKEIKDTQIIRFRGTAPTNLHGVYLSRADETLDTGRGHGRGRGRYQGRGGKGRSSSGRGRGRGPSDPPITTIESIKPSDIICWSCGKKGHRSSVCPTKAVHFAESGQDAEIFLTTIADFSSTAEDKYPEDTKSYFERDTIPVLSTTSTVKNKKLYLDTQSGIHLISNSALLVEISDTLQPITVQGITGDRTKVRAEGTIQALGIIAY